MCGKHPQVYAMMILFFVLTALLAGVDQLTKYFAADNLTLGSSVKLISLGGTDILKFSLFHNTGAAFSSFEGKTIMLSGFTFLLIGAIVFYVLRFKPDSKAVMICMALIAGGGIGNLIDRIRLGYVTDYIILWPFSFVFNFADICVVFGAIILLLYYLLCEIRESGKNGRK